MKRKEFNRAICMLEHWIKTTVETVPYKVVKDAPSSYRAMRDFYDTWGYFGINGESSDKTIYSTPLVNIYFRAIHDKMHYDYELKFTFKDEKRLSQITAMKVSSDLIAQGLDSETALNVYRVVDAEIKGQIEYYEKNKSFIVDQMDYLLSYLHVV